MFKFYLKNLVFGLVLSSIFSISCTKSNSCTGGPSVCGASGSQDNTGNGGNSKPDPKPPPPPPPPQLDPAINPNKHFNGFSDYCTTINAYANEKLKGNAKVFGCWQLVTANGQQSCKSGDIFSLCGGYIFDPYRTFHSYGCGAVKGPLPGIKSTTQLGNQLDAAAIYSYAFDGGAKIDDFNYDESKDEITINAIQNTSNLLLPQEQLVFKRTNTESAFNLLANKDGCALPALNPKSK